MIEDGVERRLQRLLADRAEQVDSALSGPVLRSRATDTKRSIGRFAGPALAAAAVVIVAVATQALPHHRSTPPRLQQPGHPATTTQTTHTSQPTQTMQPTQTTHPTPVSQTPKAPTIQPSPTTPSTLPTPSRSTPKRSTTGTASPTATSRPSAATVSSAPRAQRTAISARPPTSPTTSR